MAYKVVNSLDAETTISIGGFNKKTRQDNPLSAEGYYLGAKVVDSQKSKSGKANLHIFQTPTGNLGVWGKTDMDRKLSSVEPGTMTRVSFKNMKKVPTGEMYIFLVETDDTNTIDVSSIASNEGSDSEYGDQDGGEYGGDAEGGYGNPEDQEETGLQLPLAATKSKTDVQALLNRNKNGKRTA